MCDLHLALPDISTDQRERIATAQRAARSRWN